MPTQEELSTPRFDALHGDLKLLNEKVQQIALRLAEMSGEKIGMKLEKHENKIEALEKFNHKIVGALAIIVLIWTPLCTIVAGLIIFWLTQSR